MQNNFKRYWLKLLPLFIMAAFLLSGCSEQMIVLDPKGPIGEGQKDLIIITTLLCAVILVPVLILTVFILFRYRDKPGNKADYRPNWSHNNTLELIWWGIPVVIIAILGVITVKGTHELEPSKPIASDKDPVVIQVTSLDWKWLFKYPEQDIATVNYLKIPEDVPIKFELTSDAPMNSFWIPQLGGQIYTMSGMAMTLYLQADEPGTYYGSGANFSGEYFADMTFDVEATSEEKFDQWVQEVKHTSPALTKEGYEELAKPGTTEELSYSAFPEGLFDEIVNKYAPGGSMHHVHSQLKAADPAESVDTAENTEATDHTDH